jgi:thioredoxin reductase (NADPH)
MQNDKNQDISIEKLRCLIIGSGPAGYTAAIYASRANINPVLYEGLQPGGQLTSTTDIENFPGYAEGISGPAMMEDLKKQALRFGTDVRFGIVSSVDFSSRPLKVVIDENKIIEAHTVIIATGATAKYLGLESEKRFIGQGVSACATCDGFFYRKQDVAVVGGGDTAAEEAAYLSGLCNKVYLIVRKNYLRASVAMQKKLEEKPNVEILYGHSTKEITGDFKGVSGALLLNPKGEEVKIDITGFFVAIGHSPNSEIFSNYLERDEVGYIKTIDRSTRTGIDGVFACGDVQDPVYRQAVTAAGSGCMAAIDAERYLCDNNL